MWLPFLFSFIPAMLLPHLFPALKLFTFAPFLVIALYKKPLVSALWIALGVGLFYDLLSGGDTIGKWSVAYPAALFLISPLKRSLFEDSLSTIPLLTFAFSLVLTLIFLFPHFSFSEVLLYPFFDALFAALFFCLPMQLLTPPIRRAYFL